MEETPVLSWKLVTTTLSTPFIKAWAVYTQFLNIVFDVFAWHVLYAARTINVILNLQWVNTLNVFQNIGYNMYMPDSRGNRSMHASMLLFAATIAGVTMYSEILKYVRLTEYQFSTGFYASLTLLLGIVQLAFTRRENEKFRVEHISNPAQQPNASTSEVATEELEEHVSEEPVTAKKKSLK